MAIGQRFVVRVYRRLASVTITIVIPVGAKLLNDVVIVSGVVLVFLLRNAIIFDAFTTLALGKTGCWILTNFLLNTLIDHSIIIILALI